MLKMKKNGMRFRVLFTEIHEMKVVIIGCRGNRTDGFALDRARKLFCKKVSIS